MEATLPISIAPARPKVPAVLMPRRTSSGLLRHVLDHFVPHARNNYHPYIFGHRLTHLLSMLLVSLKICSISLLAFGPVLPAFSSAITPANIINLTNQSRGDFQLAALSENPVLDKAAQAKADDMLAKGYFSHTSPDGRSPWDFIVAAGYNYITAGENLAVNFTEAENVETAWMNSPGHRANILNHNFQEIGIGISQGEYQGHTAIFVVQMFGTPAGQKIVLSDQPTPIVSAGVPAPTPVVRAPAPAAPALAKASNPPVASAPQPSAPPVAAAPVPSLAVYDTQVSVEGDHAQISVKASESAVKVLVSFGGQGALLDPKLNGLWQGSVALPNLLAQASTAATVKVFDMAGNTVTKQLADFSSSTPANFGAHGTVASAQVTVGGVTFSPKAVEQQLYLLFVTAMLVSLVIAIGVHRHIQHVSVVANGSLVVILAVLLWMT